MFTPAFFINPIVIVCTLLAPASWLVVWIIWNNTRRIQSRTIRIIITAVVAILLYMLSITFLMFLPDDIEPTLHRGPTGAYDE